MKKRLLSLFLALVMVGSTLSVCASAEETQPQEGTPTYDHTFTLEYNVNGGLYGDVPKSDSMHYTMSDPSNHTFTINLNKPTNGEKHFMGWDTSPSLNTDVAQLLQPGGKITVGKSSAEGNSSKASIYAIWSDCYDTYDTNYDGFCDYPDCGKCVHEKENDYCTVEGCTHSDECCPKPVEEDPDPAPTLYAHWRAVSAEKANINPVYNGATTKEYDGKPFDVTVSSNWTLPDDYTGSAYAYTRRPLMETSFVEEKNDATNVGEYELVLILGGDDNYKSFVPSAIKISVTKATPKVTVDAKDATYTGSPYDAASLVKINVEGVNNESLTYGVTYYKCDKNGVTDGDPIYSYNTASPGASGALPTDAGYYKVGVTVQGHDNYEDVPWRQDIFQIKKAEVKVDFTAPGKQYDGQPYEAGYKITSKGSGAELTNNYFVQYSVSDKYGNKSGNPIYTYKTNKWGTSTEGSLPEDAGYYVISVCYEGDANHEQGWFEQVFQITKADYVIHMPGNTRTVTYNGKPQNVKAVIPEAVTEGLPAGVTVQFKNGAPALERTNAGTYTQAMTADDFVVNGGNNYDVSLSIDGKLELIIRPMDIKDAVISDIAPVTYTGDEHKPTPSVTVQLGYDGQKSDSTLTKDTDYTLSYSNNINAGTATVTVTGKGNFTGTATKNFTINKAPITVTYTGELTQTYTGDTFAVDMSKLSITNSKGEALKFDPNKVIVKFQLPSNEYGDAVDVGTYKLYFIVSGSNVLENDENYGSSVVWYSIEIKKASIIPEYTGATTQVYDAEEFDVDLSKLVLTGATESYTKQNAINYFFRNADRTDNTAVKAIDVGTYRLFIIVPGDANHNGYTLEVYVTITKSPITADYTGTLTKVYDGEKFEPDMSELVLTGAASTYDRSKISYFLRVTKTSDAIDVINVGDNYELVFIIPSDSNHHGYSLTKKPVSVTPADISTAEITLDPTSFTYTSEECKPTATVTWNGKTLEKDTDYTVSYENNVNAGTATVTITGIGNFKNTATKDFTIEPADISEATITLNPESYTYNTAACEPAETVKWNGKTLEKDTDYTVSYENNVNAGTATVTITGIGNFKNTATKTFTINTAELTGDNVTIAPAEKEWTGSALTVNVTVKYTHEGKSEITLNAGTDYTVSYENNVNVGTATVTVTGKGNYSGTVNKTFTIKNATYTGNIEFTVKTGASHGNNPVQGAVFGLYTDRACTNCIQSATSDSTGTVSFVRTETIAPNATVTYYVKQISAPSGYSKDSRTYEVVLIPVAGKGTFTFTKTALTTSSVSSRTVSYSVQTLSVDNGVSVLSADGDFENPPIDSGSGSGSGSGSTGDVVSVITVTFVDGTEYDLEPQKGTSLNKDGSIAITLSGAKLAESKIPGVIPADNYYKFVDWAVEDKDGELVAIDLETYRFTRSTKVYAVMKDLWTPYTDMKQDRSDWYYQYARDLSIAGVINGVPGGAFAPTEEVTWGVALKMVMLAVGYDEQLPTSKNWASGYLTAALRDGLVTDANIDLNATLTRLEYATLAARAMGLKEVKIDTPFMDTRDPAVLALYKAGIVEGDVSPIGRMFNPDSNITRAELAAIIWRINKYED